MQSLSCAACAAPLRADAAGHGHYRMKSAAVGAVAACSRPCGAIGLMLAAIGAPPTKRTAGDAELAANEPKAGRGGCDDPQRQADRQRVELWSDIIARTMAMLATNPANMRQSSAVAAMALSVGADISDADAVQLLRPIADRLQLLLGQINDPSCPLYDMNAIGDVSRAVVARITRAERRRAIAPALDPATSMLYRDTVPDIHDAIAAFVAPSIPHSCVNILHRVSYGEMTVVCGKQFFYVGYDGNGYWYLVYTYGGVLVAKVDKLEFSPMTSICFEVPDARYAGGLLFLDETEVESTPDQYDPVINLNLESTRGTERLIINKNVVGRRIAYDDDDNIVWNFDSETQQIQRITVDQSGVRMALFSPKNVLMAIERTMEYDAYITYHGIKNGFWNHAPSPKPGSDRTAHIIDFAADTVQSADIDSSVPAGMLRLVYTKDNRLYALYPKKTTRFNRYKLMIARYETVPNTIKKSDFVRVGDAKPYENTEGVILTVGVNGNKLHVCMYNANNLDRRSQMNLFVIDTKMF